MITIIDYGLGNLGSVRNALNRLNIESRISNKSADMLSSDGLILPGVGSAGQGMKNIRERKLQPIIRQAIDENIPLLGICLGMQLLFTWSEEENTQCLNLIEGSVQKFRIENFKVPHMGWNTVSINQENTHSNALLNNIPNSSCCYFVHSYYCDPANNVTTAAQTSYGVDFTSVIASKRIFGTQFHPEKSGTIGEKILKNYSLYCVNGLFLNET